MINLCLLVNCNEYFFFSIHLYSVLFNLIKMTSLLKTWLVKYKCACSAWFPLCQLHFCRKCSRLKCPICIIEEIDIIFCPNCLENNTSADSLQKRYRCPTCHECPMCGRNNFKFINFERKLSSKYFGRPIASIPLLSSMQRLSLDQQRFGNP